MVMKHYCERFKNDYRYCPRRRWINIVEVWDGHQDAILLELGARFPEVSFRLGRERDFFNHKGVMVMALLPIPHPNEFAAIVVHAAEEFNADFCKTQKAKDLALNLVATRMNCGAK